MTAATKNYHFGLSRDLAKIKTTNISSSRYRLMVNFVNIFSHEYFSVVLASVIFFPTKSAFYFFNIYRSCSGIC